MITSELKNKIISFIRSLQKESGGYSNLPNTTEDPQATLSCLKIFELFEISPSNPDTTFEYLLKHYNPETHAFKNPASNQDNVFTTAGCLLGIKNLGAKIVFNNIADDCIKYMSDNATIREEHFMTIGVVDECKLNYIPQNSIDFFNSQLNDSGIFGDSVLNNAISASALLRAGIKPDKIDEIIALVLKSQTLSGGFSEDGINPNLWVSYCVMRLLDLVSETAYKIELMNWILDNIDYLISDDGKNLSANFLYQNLSILNWIINPIFKAAEDGDIDTLSKQIKRGFPKNSLNLTGWSLLQRASVRGNSEIVEYLLNDDDSPAADIGYKLESADASSFYFAGQSGDLNTIMALLKHKPENLFEISRINGHTLLLQLVFFGSEKHINSIRYIFENLSDIFSTQDESALGEIQLKLTSASNVRGYNISSMAELWGNSELKAIALQHDISTTESRNQYLTNLLQDVRKFDSTFYSKNTLTDEFVEKISNFFKKINSQDYDLDNIEFDKNNLIEDLQKIISNPEFDINQLGGILSETPIITAITGVDSSKEVATARYEISKYLLESGADADIEELHPMRVDAVIRASVLNHFNILQLIYGFMKPLAFKFAMNCKPAVNGQTALQDSVHRALTSSGDALDKHLEQISWMIKKGADIDIDDHTGKSPHKLALSAMNDDIFKKNAGKVIAALEINNTKGVSIL
ncbi:MAG: hypothetical protein KIT33_09955 [Candidatus Kapabacteria bacterium]|nr:hypothetical protein [Ignavibacteriota bacterium]MCW5885281.1 hypothetical protein [Candidatus Kapabacteria bacterium]